MVTVLLSAVVVPKKIPRGTETAVSSTFTSGTPERVMVPAPGFKASMLKLKKVDEPEVVPVTKIFMFTARPVKSETPVIRLEPSVTLPVKVRSGTPEDVALAGPERANVLAARL